MTFFFCCMCTPRGTGMGCNDLTSPVLQMRKYQTRQLQILSARVGLRVLDVHLLRARALPLAASLFLGVTLNHVSFEQVKQRVPSWNFDGHACDACKSRQRQQVMRSRRAWILRECWEAARFPTLPKSLSEYFVLFAKE